MWSRYEKIICPPFFAKFLPPFLIITRTHYNTQGHFRNPTFENPVHHNMLIHLDKTKSQKYQFLISKKPYFRNSNPLCGFTEQPPIRVLALFFKRRKRKSWKTMLWGSLLLLLPFFPIAFTYFYFLSYFPIPTFILELGKHISHHPHNAPICL